MIDTLSSASAGRLVSTTVKLGISVIQGPDEERAISRVIREALTETLMQEQYREQIEDEAEDVDAWSSFLQEFFADPIVCLLLLRVVFRQEQPDLEEVRERLKEIDFHVDRLPFDFNTFLSEFTLRLEASAQEEVRRWGSALANRAEQDKLDFLVEMANVLLSTLAAGGRVGEKSEAVAVGIRSFTRWAEGMKDETDHLLRLEKHFNERKIKNPDLWRTEVYPELEGFLMTVMEECKPYHLHLCAHVSLAFACGYVLDPKSGVDVAPVQRTPSGPDLWRPEPGSSGTEEKIWDLAPIALDRPGEGVAVAVSVTHPVLNDVRDYVRQVEETMETLSEGLE